MEESKTNKEEVLEETVEEEMPDEFDELRKKAESADEISERLLRLSAEFDNYKKRTVKEKESLFNDGRAACATEFLALADNVDRAYTAICEAGADDNIKQGIEMIIKQLGEIFKGLGVEEIPAVGEEFNPELHNAVMNIEKEGEKPGTIVEEFQKGYKMNDKVIRYSMVGVTN